MAPAEKPARRPALRWISIVGARPQFIKLAPVCRAIEEHNERKPSEWIEHCIINTGQHYDREVADLLFVQMRIPEPKHNLMVGSGSQAEQIARIIERIEPAIRCQEADWIIVYGDTNSTLAGALIAARLKLPLAHVEAGCRSGDLAAPEEQNRIVADHLSRLLLAPSQHTLRNLEREGIGSATDTQRRRVVLVGDVMYDALLQNRTIAGCRADETLDRYGLKSGEYYLLTLHRANNTDDIQRLESILTGAISLDRPVLFPVHPRTKHALTSVRVQLGATVQTVPPLGYFEMIALQQHARKVLTDSGGVQKEAFYLGVPCVTLRHETEWPETVSLGANKIAGTDPRAIREAVDATHSRWDGSTPYGDGHSAPRIVAELLSTSLG